MKSYSGRNVYITGGSSGIGLAAAKQFAGAGANVAIFSRDQKKLDAALPLIEAARVSARQKFLAVQLDVGNHAEVETKMAEAVHSLGVPDVLVNCAGVAWCHYLEQTPYEEFERMMTTDFFGVRNTVAALVPFMKERGGNIVNVASILGVVGVFGYSAYCPSKFAVVGFSEVLRAELKKYNIRVSVLCPPDTDTPQLAEENRTKPPETRAISGNAGLMQPEQVAAAMIKGMERGKLMIVPGFMNWLTWTMKRLWPGFVFSLMDSDVRKVQAKKGSGQNPRNPEPPNH
jgi:NAD(P)-dependent dehydrogenase (short-subunit alcohol dehydrogenase family)